MSPHGEGNHGPRSSPTGPPYKRLEANNDLGTNTVSYHLHACHYEIDQTWCDYTHTIELWPTHTPCLVIGNMADMEVVRNCTSANDLPTVAHAGQTKLRCKKTTCISENKFNFWKHSTIWKIVISENILALLQLAGAI